VAYPTVETQSLMGDKLQNGDVVIVGPWWFSDTHSRYGGQRDDRQFHTMAGKSAEGAVELPLAVRCDGGFVTFLHGPSGYFIKLSLATAATWSFLVIR
jgi:hypothetical protein